MNSKNNKLNDFWKKLKAKKNKIIDKINYKRSHKYFIFVAIFFIGYTFFFSSGFIFDTNRERKSTEIGIENKMENSIVKIVNEEVNNNTGLLQVNLDIEKTNILFDNSLEISAIERGNLNKKLNVKTLRLDDSQYVLLIQVPKKWTNVAIDIKEKNIDNASSTKVFIDENLCIKNDNLKELTVKDYLIENVNLEIKNINNEMQNYDKDIANNNEVILKTEQQIKTLEENLKYEIKEEADKTNQQIETLKANISSAKENINELNKKKDIDNEKINKLNLKKEDYQKNYN